MDELINSMKKLLANFFVFRLKAQMYHWNCEGHDFIQYHEYFGTLYSEADSEIDKIAETIRTLGAYVPGSFNRFIQLTDLIEEDTIPSCIEMIKRLKTDNEKIHSLLLNIHILAENEKQFSIVNYIEELLSKNEKTNWFLSSIIKI